MEILEEWHGTDGAFFGMMTDEEGNYVLWQRSGEKDRGNPESRLISTQFAHERNME